MVEQMVTSAIDPCEIIPSIIASYEVKRLMEAIETVVGIVTVISINSF